MDKNGKLFGKISILDLFVVVLILGVIVGTTYRYTSSETAETLRGNTTIQYNLRISGVRDFTLENYHIGLECFDTATNESLGVITAIRVEPLREIMETLSGELAWAERTDVIDIFLDIEATGIETEQSYLLNGTYELKAGSEILMSTKYIYVMTTVESITAAQ